jgi:hypothetical protein
LLDQVVGAIAADRNLWVRIMVRDEYGLQDAARSPWRARPDLERIPRFRREP